MKACGLNPPSMTWTRRLCLRAPARAYALATLALVIFLAIYNRVSKPVNTALTAAALDVRVPGDARQLQAPWDSVINARVALQTLALAALCVALAAV